MDEKWKLFWDLFWAQMREEGLVVVSQRSHLEGLFLGLRQDWYSAAKLEQLGLFHELELWLALNKPNLHAFFAYHKEPDSHKNDGWGHAELFRCIYAETADGKTHLLKIPVTKFYN